MKKSDKRIDILIVGGNYIGKGAEAMMLVTRDQIKKKLPNARFWVKPGNLKDAEKFKSDGFNLIYKKSTIRFLTAINILTGFLFSPFKNKKPNMKSEMRLSNAFRATDAMVDISGFASSDKFGPGSARGRWMLATLASFSGNKIIYLPQSWGPFQNKKNRRYTRWMLKKASLVFARERISYQHLIETNCVKPDQVFVSKDIAFLFQVENCEKIAGEAMTNIGLKEPSRPYVTITPNMQIYRRMEGEDTKNHYIQIVFGIIQHFLNNTNLNIVLIPHEASYHRRNDMELCALLKDMAKTPDRIGILKEGESAASVKAVIGCSEFLLASRYHSLVAALSMRKPVGVIGWAHKYDELMEDVGLSDYVVDPTKNQQKIPPEKVIIKAYEEREMIIEKIKKTVPKIEQNIDDVFDKTVKTLREK